MGFFSKIFGGTSKRRNPYRDMSVRMPGLMNAYFEDLKKQLRQAELAQVKLQKEQTRLFDKTYDQRRRALNLQISSVKNRKSALEPVLKRVEAGAISRGLGMTTAPDTKKFALSAQEEMGRQRELEGLNLQKEMLLADRYAAKAKMTTAQSAYRFDPTAFLDFEKERARLQPWQEMGRPITYSTPGFLGGAAGQLLGSAGGAAIAGLI